MVPSGAALRVVRAGALIFGAVICQAQLYSTSVSSTSGQGIPAGAAAAIKGVKDSKAGT